jgi:hypothetical protein
MKSINRTFRLDVDLLKTAHEIAHRKNVSLNEFVADALREAAARALMEGIEMEEVPSAFMAKIMEYVPLEKVAELGKWATITFLPQLVWQTFKELSPDTIIKAYELLGKKYKQIITVEHHKEGNEHTLKILHSRGGQKWSVYHAESMRSAFKNLVGVEIEVEWGPNEVRGKFTEPNASMVKGRQIPQITG